ncbi:MAG: PIN domain-containing protein [Halobacteriota archaeon]|nr:PIN domain-containing protein [Halobacteriota archaeon]
MEIVADTNVIISALLRDGLTRKLLLLAPFDFYTVAYSKIEIETHRNELLNRSKLDEEAFQYLIDLIFSKICVVESNVIEAYRKKAIDVMRGIDISDSPFIALAMHLNCSIWSNDKHFKEQNVVKAYTTKEIMALLGEAAEE